VWVCVRVLRWKYGQVALPFMVVFLVLYSCLHSWFIAQSLASPTDASWFAPPSARSSSLTNERQGSDNSFFPARGPYLSASCSRIDRFLDSVSMAMGEFCYLVHRRCRRHPLRTLSLFSTATTAANQQQQQQQQHQHHQQQQQTAFVWGLFSIRWLRRARRRRRRERRLRRQRRRVVIGNGSGSGGAARLLSLARVLRLSGSHRQDSYAISVAPEVIGNPLQPADDDQLGGGGGGTSLAAAV